MDVSVTFDSDDTSIYGITFSVDYDESCLNPDADGDGILDSVDRMFPALVIDQMNFDSSDTDGEIDVIAFAQSTIAEGAIVRIAFAVSSEAACLNQTAAVRFARFSGQWVQFAGSGFRPVSGWVDHGSVRITSAD